MTYRICALSDQERAALAVIPDDHAHKWGMWFTDDPGPGIISDRCKRVCKCGAYQVSHRTPWGTLKSEPRTVML